jgi:hypothetical protein
MTDGVEPAPGLRCSHCKGPVRHDASIGCFRCHLCGAVEVFDFAARGYRECDTQGCEYGWIAEKRSIDRACGGTGLKVA